MSPSNSTLYVTSPACDDDDDICDDLVDDDDDDIMDDIRDIFDRVSVKSASFGVVWLPW